MSEFRQLDRARTADLARENTDYYAGFQARVALGLNVESTDAQIKIVAHKASALCYSYGVTVAPIFDNVTDLRGALARYVTEQGITAPPETISDAGACMRMLDTAWWRRRLRVMLGRTVEQQQIAAGRVHCRGQIYASNVTVSRRQEQRERNRKILESLTAENQDGYSATLAALSEKGVSCSRLRRLELMTRVRGFEDYAKERGDVGEFWTLTAPSRFHSTHKKTGEKNLRYDGSTPKQAQAHLARCWSRFRAALHRLKINVYGFRVVEPHHDGCPHWHALLFMAPDVVKTVRALARLYFLDQHDPDEPGAKKNRCKFVTIDKRGASGYIAKYIAKNIDGHLGGSDKDGNAIQGDGLFGHTDKHGTPAEKAAIRIESWARRWGIRQFQQIGGAAVGVWRELRRLKPAEQDKPMPAALERARQATGDKATGKKADFAEYLRAMAAAPVILRKTDAGIKWNGEEGVPALTRYEEPVAPTVFGLACADFACVTRKSTWTIKPASRASAHVPARDFAPGEYDFDLGFDVAVGPLAPWTCVNNCTEAIEDGNKSQHFARRGGPGCPPEIPKSHGGAHGAGHGAGGGPGKPG